MKLWEWIKRMIELIQGTTSTPVDDIRRQEIPSRLAIEKGMYPDEAVVVGQVSGGDGIIVEQTDGFDENYNLDLKSRGNLIIDRDIFESELYVDVAILPYLTLNNTEESMKLRFGKLLNRATLIVNGVQYNYGDWFELGTYNVSGFEQYAVKWLGDDMFELTETDSVTLRI